MIVHTCVAEEISTNYGGKGSGRLQIFLGAGGTGNLFVVDSVITTLSQL